MIVQVPAAGNPFNTMLPVGTVQVGCVMVPIIGLEGVAFIVTVVLAITVHAPDTTV